MSVGSSNPNNAWASASTSQRQLPRGTSQEYEAQAQVAAHRRLGAKPPSRNSTAPSGLAASGPRRHVVHRHDSSHLSVPDSEPEREEATSRNTRGKSPFAGAMNAVNSVAQGLGQAATEVAFILRARSKEPEGPEESYNYSREEREVQAQASTSGSTTARKNVTAANRKNRMSSDNMAYKPSNSDLDISDEDDSDGEGKKRRRKKKRGEVGGPLNSLPVLSADKRRKKRRGKKADGDDDEASEDDSREEVIKHFRICEVLLNPSVDWYYGIDDES
jgi:SUN domain-containing protein 1/2